MVEGLNRRGAAMLFVIIGAVLILVALLFWFLRTGSEPEAQPSTTWEQPVEEYLRLCMQEATDNAVDRIFKGAGYMIDETSLPDGFGSAKLLQYDYTVPVHNSNGDYTVITVFDTDPAKVKRLPDAPCFSDSADVGAACNQRSFFTQNAEHPYGAGAISEFQYRELPRVALYKDDPGIPYKPECDSDHPCDVSVEEQVETFVGLAMDICLAQATTLFDERGINLEQRDSEDLISVTVRDDGLRVHLSPITAEAYRETKLLDSISYLNNKRLKQLFALAHGGSTDYVLGATGIIEAESRDPDFMVERDGGDFLQNVLFLDPASYAVRVEGFEGGTSKVVLSHLETSFSFIIMNRKPFLNQVAPAQVSLAGREKATVPIPAHVIDAVLEDGETFSDLTGAERNVLLTFMRDNIWEDELESERKHATVSFNYALFLDARDPDDTRTGNEAFRSNNDQLTVTSLDILDDGGGRFWLDPNYGSEFTYNPQSRELGFRIIIGDGYDVTYELPYSLETGGEESITAPAGTVFLYVDEFDVQIPLRITVRDSQGNVDYISIDATAEYKYGWNLTNGEVLYRNNATLTFDQLWPWLILPNVDRGRIENQVYFYEPEESLERCTVDFANMEDMDVQLLGTRFLADKNLSHLDEYAPDIYRAIVTVMREENMSFGIDQCCPSYDLMTKFRDRGICAPELCCLSAPFMGHEIRFFEKGAWNTTSSYSGEVAACNLERDFNQIGGDYYAPYLPYKFGMNQIMAIRENLDILLTSEEEATAPERAVIQALPLRFSPDLINTRTGESYQGPMEHFFQTFAALARVPQDDPGLDSSDTPDVQWEFTWEDNQQLGLDQISDMFGIPGMFEEGWTWWDYREVIQECDDWKGSRDIETGDCVPEELEGDYGLPAHGFNVFDPYVCGPDDQEEQEVDLVSIANFSSAQDRCPNLLETMREIMKDNSSCTVEGCCFEPPLGRVFVYYTGDPVILEQYGSWVPEYAVPGTALVLDPPGIRPAECPLCDQVQLCDPGEDCPGTLVTQIDCNLPFASGGPFGAISPDTRINNFQWTDRATYGYGLTNKRAGDTAATGEGEIEYKINDDSACSVGKVLHRCSYAEGLGYDADTFHSSGVDPKTIGVRSDGTRSCPGPEEAYLQMINGTCTKENCCLEIRPTPWRSCTGAPGGGPLGNFVLPCPLLGAEEPIDDDVDINPPPPGPAPPPSGHASGGFSW